MEYGEDRSYRQSPPSAHRFQRAAWIPPFRALPYPRSWMCTTLAPTASAISMEPSVEPLSATITSPRRPADSKHAIAFETHVPTVSCSFRHGKTIEISMKPSATAVEAPEVCCGEFIMRLKLRYGLFRSRQVYHSHVLPHRLLSDCVYQHVGNLEIAGKSLGNILTHPPSGQQFTRMKITAILLVKT